MRHIPYQIFNGKQLEEEPLPYVGKEGNRCKPGSIGDALNKSKRPSRLKRNQKLVTSIQHPSHVIKIQFRGGVNGYRNEVSKRIGPMRFWMNIFSGRLEDDNLAKRDADIGTSPEVALLHSKIIGPLCRMLVLRLLVVLPFKSLVWHRRTYACPPFSEISG